MRTLTTFFLWIAAFYLGFGVLMFVFQRGLMYHTDQSVPQPSAYALIDVEAVRVPTEDGLELFAWWRQPKTPDSPVIAYFHGNAGHIGYRADKITPYLKRGYGVLLVTYRYNAKTGGSPSQEGLYRDGRAALEFLRARKIPRERIALYGESLGTAVAIATARAGGRKEAACLLLEAAFDSMSAVAQHHYPYLPARWLIRDRYDSASSISQLQIPILMIHGRRDRIVPLKFAEALAAAAPEKPQLLVVDGAGHNNLYDYGVANRVIAYIEQKCRG
ncbi:MAG TPA: hypothetical protein DCS82_05540 [Rhodospirillaceae bacterium]|nr:hypothetical protein [Rhodospirillaceae bacterium]HAT35158.1 hypothetical protein [Rhodospirillaceae bacterium]